MLGSAGCCFGLSSGSEARKVTLQKVRINAHKHMEKTVSQFCRENVTMDTHVSGEGVVTVLEDTGLDSVGVELTGAVGVAVALPEKEGATVPLVEPVAQPEKVEDTETLVEAVPVEQPEVLQKPVGQQLPPEALLLSVELPLPLVPLEVAQASVEAVPMKEPTALVQAPV